jgi:Xaa-Pro aminopeptidase
LVVHDERYAGKGAAAKRQEMADWLVAKKADAAVLSALDSIAWTFNIRGRDVERTPVALAYAIVHADATADLYVAPGKIGEDVVMHLGNAVRVHDRADFAAALGDFEGRKVVADPERAVAAIFDALEKGGAEVLTQRDPAVLPKAVKNATEIAGHKAAQARDGAALSRYLHWVSTEAPKGGVDEMSAADRLRAFREDTGMLKDLSFDTISGAGPNGAVVHYRVEEKTNRPLEMGTLYLVDSGGQYLDGTTDITRTVAIGEPSADMRRRFTLVLKGHIALARATFPKGTRGGQLDVLARQYLWANGLDYAHGTGHGVGSFLSVHEGPQRIATFSGGDEPLQPGMILSNEPGYYKTGEYGIRIENLVLVVEREIPGAEQAMLGFETLSFAPIDRTLVDRDMLGAEERAWLDAYHAKVLEIVGTQVEGEAKAWLERVCAPI